MDEYYSSFGQWIESDTWMNYRQKMRSMMEYEFEKEILDEEDYWGRGVRKRILKEHKDELESLIIKDLQAEVKRLENHQEEMRMRRISDRY